MVTFLVEATGKEIIVEVRHHDELDIMVLCTMISI
mgnify:CR=1 FL=1